MAASDRPVPGPDDAQPRSGAGGPGGGRLGAWWWVGAAVVAIGLGVGGYFLGKSTGEDDVRAEYKPGQPAYRQIFAAGAVRGAAAGAAAGRVQGQKQGQAEGQARGAAPGG